MCRGYPFTEQMRFTVAPPGQLPLRNTLFSLVDVPDLRALAVLWPEALLMLLFAAGTLTLATRAFKKELA